jgi:predicted CopG family antitoxin
MKKPKTKSFTTISISHDNHNQLQKLGNLGDTFDEVLTKVLKKLGSDQDSVAGGS